ncbi:hypothetical protein KUTeg_016540 [Tegillarca granosa]|uniref:DNA methyltransferase 1-associated protein 1 n=1 Tax=Tegillarca granosa TaxID=220873 RepID=A0ABQ9ER06_TEGGR|nr:hypothetical protein KUTeg_016540 [Tegillarca granosa]
MALNSDVRDILELESDQKDFITKEALLNDGKKKKPLRKSDVSFKRPEGMHRELWDAPPIIPTDTHQGYKQMKAKIGSSKVRPWKWMPFTNPARKVVDVPAYSDLEYQQHLHDDSWTRQETDHLFDLCKRFDLRFIVIHDRWDREKHPNRSVEDLKERYYNICNILTKVEEEENLIAELKKIELRKKEREKKTQDLQKLITAADSNIDSRRADRKLTKKKVHQQQKIREGVTTPEPSGIKFADFKTSEFNPVPSEEICTHFNELRQDIVLLYELKSALATCDYELETLRHRYETLAPGSKAEDLGVTSDPLPSNSLLKTVPQDTEPDSPSKIKTEPIDRKRKAALEQSNLLKKIKQKS